MERIYASSILYLRLYERPSLIFLGEKCVRLLLIHTCESLFCYFKMVVMIRERAKATHVIDKLSRFEYNFKHFLS